MKTIAIAFITTLLAGAAFAQDDPAPSGNVQNGEKYFLADGCYQCHNVGGYGASTGPKIRRTALLFESFLHQLRSPASQMPPYEAAVVSDDASHDIYAYLESLPDTPDPKSLPLLTKTGVK